MNRPQDYVRKRIEFCKTSIKKGYTISYLADLFNVSEYGLIANLRKNINLEDYIILKELEEENRDNHIEKEAFILTLEDVLEKEQIYTMGNARYVMVYDDLDEIRERFYRDKKAKKFYTFYVTSSDWIAPIIMKYPIIFWDSDNYLSEQEKNYVRLAYYLTARGFYVKMFEPKKKSLKRAIAAQGITIEYVD